MSEKKIYIGYYGDLKLLFIRRYLQDHPEIKEIVYFTHDKNEPLDLSSLELPVEYRTWSDAIMYKYFYPLLEKISNKTLIIYDEMMRVKKRNDLTYNCCHHYSNQTEHNLVFNYFPIIDAKEDFMILLDYAFPGKYKVEQYNDELLKLASFSQNPWLTINCINWTTSDGVKEEYKELLLKSFDELGMKDPDTIPRRMARWITDNVKLKREHIYNPVAAKIPGKPEVSMLVRSIRKSGDSRQHTYKDYDNLNDCVLIYEFPNRQLEFNDFCYYSHQDLFSFVNTGLSVDQMYYDKYTEFARTVKEMIDYA